MKILQLNPAFYPAFSYGGTVNVSYTLARELVKRGHEVTVFTSDTISRNERFPEKHLIHEGISVHYFKNLSNFLAWRRYAVYPALVHKLRDSIRDFDIVHLHGSRNFQNIIAHHYAAKYNIPYVLQAHGSLREREKLLIKSLFDIAWGYSIYRDAHTGIALSITEAEQYRALGMRDSQIKIIPNGIDLAIFSSLPPKGSFRTLYDIEEQSPMIVYIGRLHESKGLSLLIDAFILVHKEFPEAKLVLIGPDDAYQDTLNKRVQESKIDNAVIFSGFVPADKKLMALVDADAFITPNYSGFPITFLEACACGVPIITTVRGDNLGWIDNNVGFVVNYSREDLSRAIMMLLRNRDLQNAFRNNSRPTIQNFSLPRWIDRMEQIYQNATGSGASR